LRSSRRRGADLPADRAEIVTHDQAVRMLRDARRASEPLTRCEENPSDGSATPETSK
jgi:hypothetical protein